MPNILIVGATRGLGASMANQYASHPRTTVYGTTRSAEPPTGKGHNEKIKWAKGIDLNEHDAGKKLVEELRTLGVEGGIDTMVSCVLSSISA
jgi:NAD(P)-dependent dehydrogenase (short-subunit alcohol dehydrogenase family)